MTPFFRYLRPVEFDAQLHAPKALETGGVSFQVVKAVALANSTCNVTASIIICDRRVAFNRQRARSILESNATAEYTFKFNAAVPLEAETLAKAFVLAVDNGLVEFANEVYARYVGNDGLSNMADSIERILATHRSADMRAKMTLEAYEALNLKDKYENL